MIQQRFEDKFEITTEMMRRRQDMWRGCKITQNTSQNEPQYEEGGVTPLVETVNNLSFGEFSRDAVPSRLPQPALSPEKRRLSSPAKAI